MAPHDPPYYRKDLDQLEDAARTTALRSYDVLAYEIQMLKETARLATKHWDDKPLRYVLIESHALHCRNLAEFLWGKDLTKDYAPKVKARHYARPDSPWVPISRLAEIDTIAARASLEVAHLTTARISDPDDGRKRWELRSGLDHLRAGLEAFLDQADPAKCSPQVRPSIESLRANLQPIWEALSMCVGSTQLVTRHQVFGA